MHPFEPTFSVIGAFALGIMTLTLFFRCLGHLDDRKVAASPSRILLKGVLDEKTVATVHLGNGSIFENVRLVGFTDSGSIKGGFPFEFQGMAILEHPDGRRTMVQTKLIRMIEVPAKPS